jgi:hypothetical protein
MLAAAPMKRLLLDPPALRCQPLNPSARQSRFERSMTKSAPVMKSAIDTVASCDRREPKRLHYESALSTTPPMTSSLGS